MMHDPKPINLDNIPPKLRKWVKEKSSYLKVHQFLLCNKAYEAYEDALANTDPYNRKEFALYVKDKYPVISQLLFALKDKKEIYEMTWKMIKPQHNEKYKVGEE